MALSLRKNFGFALVGNLAYAASQYIVLLVFIKLYSVEDVGIFVYAGAFTTPVMMALEMQLRNFYITDRKNEFNFSDYLTFRTLTNVLGLVGLLIAAFFIKPEYFIVIFIVALIKAFESQLDLIYGVYQKEHRLDYIAYSRIVRGIVAVVVVGVISLLYRKLEYSLLAYFFSWIILYFFYERRQVVKRGFMIIQDFKVIMPEYKKMKSLLVLCVPMFVSIFIDKYYLNYPRLSVESILGIKMVGVFGSLLYFKSLGGQFISSLAQTAIPKLSSYISEGRIVPFKKLLFKMVLAGFTIGLVLAFASYLGGKPLLRFIYTDEYAKYTDVLTIILLGATVTFSYIFLGTALTCIRKQWVKLPISIVSFIILFLLITLLKINTLRDIVLVVLLVEIITFLIYYAVYIFFIRKEMSILNISKSS